MTFTLGSVAIFWGVAAGYFLLRGMDSLLGLGFCVHGLFARRWKRLANKNATGLIRPGVICTLGLRLAIYALLAGFLLDAGDVFVRRAYRFSYTDAQAVLFAVVAFTLVCSRLRTSGRRLQLVWRMSHEFDFAERRARTQRLKSKC